MRYALALLAALALAAVLAAPVLAQDPPPTPSPDEVNAIARNLYCPVCANVPLDACGTPACAQWRAQIADLLVQGYSEQEIYDYFATRYGEGVLAVPPARGLNWLIYVLPPAAILLAAFWLWRNMAAWKQARPPAPADPVEDEYTRQLDEELKARR